MTVDESIAALAMTMRSGATADEIQERASWLAAHLTGAERQELAQVYLIQEAGDLIRIETRTLERRAEQPIETKREPRRYDPELERQREEDQAHFISDLYTRIESIVAKEKIRWTHELLASSFALGDGTFVRWGDATIEQHRVRADRFVQDAASGLEAAARHQAAIQAIESINGTCLNDVIAVSAQ